MTRIFRLILSLFLLSLFFCEALRVDAKKLLEPFGSNIVTARKGDFFVYTLHSGNHFRRAEEVTWSISLAHKPTLPTWLHLMPSEHKQIAYLYGTPIGNINLLELQVVARSVNTFEVSKRELRILLEENKDEKLKGQFNGETKQVAELWLRNYAPLQLLEEPILMAHIQINTRKTFLGKRVNPYVLDLKPTNYLPNANGGRSTRGTRILIGSQQSFHPALWNLVRGLHHSQEHCRRNRIIPLDRHWGPHFQIDWCRFKLEKMQTDEFDDSERKPKEGKETDEFQSDDTAVKKGMGKEESKQAEYKGGYEGSDLSREYFWAWFWVLPVPAILLILLVLGLSFIFFGHREGQHWRDYKTPKSKIQEYMSVRQSQVALRELSAQRQPFLYANGEDRSGITQFLRPKGTSVPPPQPSPPPIIMDRGTNVGGVGPVGKQTVAEAAKIKGSTLDLYKDPAYLEEEANDSDDEADAYQELDSKHHGTTKETAIDDFHSPHYLGPL